MGNIITFIISTILQTITYSYFTLNIANIFSEKKLSKKQIFIAILFIGILGPCTQILKNIIPTLNVFIILGILLFNVYFVMKLKFLKALLTTILTVVFTAITELIAMSLTMLIFQTNVENILSSRFMEVFALATQSILMVLFTHLILKLLKTKFSTLEILKRVSYKQIILYISLLIIYIFPQMLIFTFTTYAYPKIFLVINTIQFILIFIFLSIYLKKSIENEKIQMDLYTSELHNKTLIGMVDGVRTLKHDYNNIIQSLNGYVTTKQYDKIGEHINSVLGECNVVNNLSVIDPKIFNEPAIYGIIGAKYFLANKENITFDFDIMTDIAKIQFSKPDLSRILGILLDNALEATKKAQKPYIRLEMKFDNRKNADIIRVVNTYDTNITIDVNRIYEKGFSTKEVKSRYWIMGSQKTCHKIKKFTSLCYN